MTSQGSDKPPFQAKQLLVPFLVSQALGVATAAVVFFLELGLIRFVVTGMPAEQMARAKALVLQGFSTQPWYVGLVLYGLLIVTALSAALLAQYVYLWSSPVWRGLVYSRNRPTPPKNVSEAVGVRWRIFSILLPVSLLAAPAFLWWVSR
jgi:hypothetical protein